MKAWAYGAVLLLLSWAWIQAGIILGSEYISAGPGYPKTQEVQADLFRFDSAYYLDLALNGYSFTGDVYSSPNIVFAPLFPLAVRALTWLGLPEVIAGFALNKLLLFASLSLLIAALAPRFGNRSVFFALLALTTSAGSYSFHAYYSESAMLFCVALVLFAFQRQAWLWLAFSAMLLGTSRLAAVPMACCLALYLAIHTSGWRRAVLPAMALLGSAVYLGLLAYRFGNPLVLIPQIQAASWGLFHPPTDYFDLLTGRYYLDYTLDAVDRGFSSLLDIRTLNLLWTIVGFFSAMLFTIRTKHHILNWLFLPYALILFLTNSSSEFLISAHRFMALMLPIYLLPLTFSRVPRAIWVMLLVWNAGLGLLHTGHFNQGTWYWF